MAGQLRYHLGAWRLRVEAGLDPVTGKRRQVHRTVKGPNNKTGRAAAEKAMANLIVEVDAGRQVPASDVTVAQLLERYIQMRSASWSPGAGDQTRRRVEQHITAHVGDRPIDRFKPIDITNLHTQWRADGQSESGAGRLHDIIRAAFRQAVRWELITRNPFDVIDRPRGKKPKITPPTPAEVQKLWKAAEKEPTLALYLRVAALTGARRGTMCALRWTDIDLATKEISFTRAIVMVPGALVEKETKEDLAYTVAIDPATVKLLKAQRTRQAKTALAVGATLGVDAFVFAHDPAGLTSWRPDGVTQRFERIRTTAKLPNVRLHDLRHYMATQMLREGFDVATVAGRGGWADGVTPTRVYAHFQPARDRAAANQLAKRLDR